MADSDKENILPDQIDSYTLPQLKGFLRSHNQNVSGRSSELKIRAKGVLQLGLPSNEKLKRADESERTLRTISKFMTPLGEEMPCPYSLKNGWTKDVVHIPDVSEKELYNYLVFNSCRTYDGDISGARKQVKARVFYEDNHVHSVSYHFINNDITHGYVMCKVIPSMPSACPKKDPDYDTRISLSKHTGQIHAAQCTCTAGEGETCNHVGALLWCLVDITSKKQDGTIAGTSEKCKWNQPRRRKLSPRRAEDVHFKKVYKSDTSKTSNYKNFNPVSSGTAGFHSNFRQSLAAVLPNAGFLKLYPKPPIPEHVKAQCCLPLPPVCLMNNLGIDSDIAGMFFDKYVSGLEFCPETVEKLTKGQRDNDLWLEARKGRVTASNFGLVMAAQKHTSLVKNVMGYYKCSTSDALEWGKKREKVALSMYIKELKKDCTTASVSESGLLILKDHPYIGASPDGIVSFGTDTGLVEIKCPYTCRNVTPEQACNDKKFCCKIVNGKVTLKTEHKYYYQIQGQMGIKGCSWCDFVIWTTKGISVERVIFNAELWDNMLIKLVKFYRQSVLPELFTARIKRGLC